MYVCLCVCTHAREHKHTYTHICMYYVTQSELDAKNEVWEMRSCHSGVAEN
jgi:hypothetical protein